MAKDFAFAPPQEELKKYEIYGGPNTHNVIVHDPKAEGGHVDLGLYVGRKAAREGYKKWVANHPEKSRVSKLDKSILMSYNK